MPKMNKSFKNSGRRSGRSARKGRRQRRRNRKNLGLGRVIASGVKTLLTKVPAAGETLSRLADIAFKNLGLTAVNHVIGSKLRFEDLELTSLVAKFDVTPSCILAGSAGCVLDGKKFYSQYVDARIISCTVRIMPSGAVKERCGDWHMGVQPYLIDTDVSTDSTPPTELGIHHMTFSTSGPMSKPLTIQYKPRVVDGRAYLFNKLEDPIFSVAIRYDCYARTDYTRNFTTEEFYCDIEISGTVECRSSNEKMELKEYKKFVVDRLNPGTYLEGVNGNSWFAETNENGEKIITRQRLASSLCLDCMAID